MPAQSSNRRGTHQASVPRQGCGRQGEIEVATGCAAKTEGRCARGALEEEKAVLDMGSSFEL